jgi:hypothetical protein
VIDEEKTKKTPLNALQASRTAGPEQRRGRKADLMVTPQTLVSRKIFQKIKEILTSVIQSVEQVFSRS